MRLRRSEDQITLSAITHGERPSVYVESLGEPIRVCDEVETSDLSMMRWSEMLEGPAFGPTEGIHVAFPGATKTIRVAGS